MTLYLVLERGCPLAIFEDGGLANEFVMEYAVGPSYGDLSIMTMDTSDEEYKSKRGLDFHYFHYNCDIRDHNKTTRFWTEPIYKIADSVEYGLKVDMGIEEYSNLLFVGFEIATRKDGSGLSITDIFKEIDSIVGEACEGDFEFEKVKKAIFNKVNEIKETNGAMEF